MEVKINKEIRNYTESMFFGLSLRQFIFSVLACGVAVGLYFLLRPRFGTETLSWVCILGAFPFAAMGFIKYNGMTAEQFAWAWIKSEFLMPKKLMFLPDNLPFTFIHISNTKDYTHFVKYGNAWFSKIFLPVGYGFIGNGNAFICPFISKILLEQAFLFLFSIC